MGGVTVLWAGSSRLWRWHEMAWVLTLRELVTPWRELETPWREPGTARHEQKVRAIWREKAQVTWPAASRSWRNPPA